MGNEGTACSRDVHASWRLDQTAALRRRASRLIVKGCII